MANDTYNWNELRKIFTRTYPYSILLDIAEGDVQKAMHMYPDSLSEAMLLLDDKQTTVLIGRYRDKLTLQQLADQFHLSRERIRQITAKALRRLRNPCSMALLTSVPLAAVQERDMEISKLEAKCKALETAYECLKEEKKPEDPPEIEPVTPEKILELHISSLKLSVRAYNCLSRANLKTIADIVSMSQSELLRIRNLGSGTACEIKEMLAGYGLSLAPETEDTMATAS